MAEELVELGFRVKAVWGGFYQARSLESRAGDFHEATLDAGLAVTAIADALAHEFGAGELVKRVGGVHGAWDSTIGRLKAGEFNHGGHREHGVWGNLGADRRDGFPS
jgi:hypothetical protein